MMKVIQLGKYFDDFIIGDQYMTVGRTVTESDIINFAGISGNFDQLHTDVEFAQKTPFKGIIAHGLIGLSFISGLIQRAGLIEGTAFAFLEISSWQFLAPLKIRDTVSVSIRVAEKKETRNSGVGVISFELGLINQRDELTQKGIWKIMIKKRR